MELGEPLGVLLGDPPVGEGPPLTLSTSCARTAGRSELGGAQERYAPWPCQRRRHALMEKQRMDAAQRMAGMRGEARRTAVSPGLVIRNCTPVGILPSWPGPDSAWYAVVCAAPQASGPQSIGMRRSWVAAP